MNSFLDSAVRCEETNVKSSEPNISTDAQFGFMCKYKGFEEILALQPTETNVYFFLLMAAIIGEI